MTRAFCARPVEDQLSNSNLAIFFICSGKDPCFVKGEDVPLCVSLARNLSLLVTQSPACHRVALLCVRSVALCDTMTGVRNKQIGHGGGGGDASVLSENQRLQPLQDNLGYKSRNRINLQAVEGDNNGFTDFGTHNRVCPATAGVVGFPTQQTEIVGAARLSTLRLVGRDRLVTETTPGNFLTSGIDMSLQMISSMRHVHMLLSAQVRKFEITSAHLMLQEDGKQEGRDERTTWENKMKKVTTEAIAAAKEKATAPVATEADKTKPQMTASCSTRVATIDAAATESVATEARAAEQTQQQPRQQQQLRQGQ
ncbi:unnamed protein product [Dibothriocephalus latus]|uniref:Uncharacterized protein n=1 Tax=Dibothriocephalus latus TaxID=60516 RepID=A0A3P6TC89_DIBLA|nr:unnamed protein product [Dibothriocephalus latus]